jgi:hypothetical protein
MMGKGRRKTAAYFGIRNPNAPLSSSYFLIQWGIELFNFSNNVYYLLFGKQFFYYLWLAALRFGKMPPAQKTYKSSLHSGEK